MNYSRDFLAQKAKRLNDERCPVFSKEQLVALFKLTDETLRGGPETFVTITGSPEKPELRGIITGERRSVPNQLLREWVNLGMTATFHTHPAPWDYPSFAFSEAKPAPRPSEGDLWTSFNLDSDALCIGGREELGRGGDIIIKCWTPPDLLHKDWWQNQIKEATDEQWEIANEYRRKQERLWNLTDDRNELMRKQDRVSELRTELEHKKKKLLREYQENYNKPQLRKKIYKSIEDTDMAIRDLNEQIVEYTYAIKNWQEPEEVTALREELDAIREDLVKKRRKVERDLQDYWGISGIEPPCIYTWEEFPKGVMSPEEEKKYVEREEGAKELRDEYRKKFNVQTAQQFEVEKVRRWESVSFKPDESTSIGLYRSFDEALKVAKEVKLKYGKTYFEEVKVNSLVDGEVMDVFHVATSYDKQTDKYFSRQDLLGTDFHLLRMEYPPLEGKKALEAMRQKEVNEKIQRKLWRWKQEGLEDMPIKGMEWYHGFRDHRSPEQIKREGIYYYHKSAEEADRDAKEALRDLDLPTDVELDLWRSEQENRWNVYVTHRRWDACGWAERSPEAVSGAIFTAAEKAGVSFSEVKPYEYLDRRYGDTYMAILGGLPITVEQCSTAGGALSGPQNCNTLMTYIPPEYIKEVKRCRKVKTRWPSGYVEWAEE